MSTKKIKIKELRILKASDVDGDYQPSPEEKKRIKLSRDHFMLSGDGVFHTIQGEGNWIGRPTTFIRLHFCNLACSWCDSWYTWHRGTKEFWREPQQILIEDLYDRVVSAQKKRGIEDLVLRIVFTGGEPMLHQAQIQKFVELYPSFEVEIETNGTIMPDKYLLERAHFNCSPKLISSGNDKALAYNEDVLRAISQYSRDPCFKFVCSTEEDVKEVVESFSFLPKQQVFIMPEGVTKEENTAVYEKIADIIIAEGLNTTCRLQNIMFDGAKRGV